MVARYLPGLILLAVLPVNAQQSFEVASVKISANSGPKFGAIRFSRETLNMRGVSLWQAIRFAYGIESFQISAPERLQSPPFYEIEAKAPHRASEPQLRLMLQGLLAERFHLKVHREQRELAVTALVVAKGGPKFTESTGRYDPARGPEMPMQFLGYDAGVHMQRAMEPGGRIRDTFTNVSMPLFASVIAMMASKSPYDQVPIINQTGLARRYDFVLVQDRSPASVEGEGTHATGADVLDSFEPVIEKQLGLKLVHRKARVEVLVIDSADKTPTPN